MANRGRRCRAAVARARAAATVADADAAAAGDGSQSNQGGSEGATTNTPNSAAVSETQAPMAAESGSTEQVADDEEVWARRQQARQRQILIGKARPEYRRYALQVSRDQRQREHPQTPDPMARIPKRQFDHTLGEWRRRLHEFDDAANGRPAETGSSSRAPATPPKQRGSETASSVAVTPGTVTFEAVTTPQAQGSAPSARARANRARRGRKAHADPGAADAPDATATPAAPNHADEQAVPSPGLPLPLPGGPGSGKAGAGAVRISLADQLLGTPPQQTQQATFNGTTNQLNDCFFPAAGTPTQTFEMLTPPEKAPDPRHFRRLLEGDALLFREVVHPIEVSRMRNSSRDGPSKPGFHVDCIDPVLSRGRSRGRWISPPPLPSNEYGAASTPSAAAGRASSLQSPPTTPPRASGTVNTFVPETPSPERYGGYHSHLNLPGHVQGFPLGAWSPMLYR